MRTILVHNVWENCAGVIANLVQTCRCACVVLFLPSCLFRSPFVHTITHQAIRNQYILTLQTKERWCKARPGYTGFLAVCKTTHILLCNSSGTSGLVLLLWTSLTYLLTLFELFCFWFWCWYNVVKWKGNYYLELVVRMLRIIVKFDFLTNLCSVVDALWRFSCLHYLVCIFA